METINERLARFVEHIGGTQPNGKGIPEVARKAGIDPNTLRVALKENASKPSFDTLSAILGAYPVLNSDWFMLGKGEMLKWGEGATAVAHARAHGEARTKAHPTVEPSDRELAAGTTTGPTMFVNEAGTLENHWKLIAEERAARLDDKDQEIARLMIQLEAWQEAFRKPLASAEAAAHLTFSTSTPIGPRFDGAPANMWVNRESQEIPAEELKAA